MNAYKDLQTPEDYVLDKVSILSERFGENEIIITSIVPEVSIFENINKYYLEANLVISDDSGLLSGADIVGTERISITVRLPQTGNVAFTKTFIVTNIDKVIKVNDYSSVFVVNCVEEHGYLANITKFSKPYTGKTEQIIEKIINDYIKVPVNNLSRTSFQKEFKVIVPYMTVDEAIRWLILRATTENGSPYYLYSSLISSSLILNDLDTILQSDPFNRNAPFIYSQAFTNIAESTKVIDRARAVLSVKREREDEVLRLIRRGVVGSNYSLTRVGEDRTDRFHFNIKNVYDKLNNTGILNPVQNRINYDRKFSINDKLVTEYNSKYIHQLSLPVFVNENNYYDDLDVGMLKTRFNSHAIKNILTKNVINIVTPGLLFLASDVNSSVGTQFSFTSLTTSPNPTRSATTMIDQKVSGDYIMFTKRHLFKQESHKVSLLGARLALPSGGP
jgi:hypothetical protein